RLGKRRRGKDSQEIKAMSRDEAGKFLAAVGAPFVAVFHFLLETGCRVGEVLALTWGDVDLDRGSVRVSKSTTCWDKQVGKTKTGEARTVDLSADVVRSLKAWALKSG